MKSIDKKIFKIIRDNYGWVIAILTFSGVIVSFLVRWSNYLFSKIKFDYYGLDYGLYTQEDTTILYDFSLSLLITLCFYSVCYSIYKIKKDFKSKEKDKKKIFWNVVIVFIFNLCLTFAFEHFSGIISKIIAFIFIFIFEIIATNFFHVMLTKEVKLKSYSFWDNVKNVPFFIIGLFMLYLFNYYCSLSSNNGFRVINDNKVIVYTTKDYYLVLDYKIDKDKMFIYKNTQNKIDNLNVNSKFIKVKEHVIINN